MFLLPVTLQVIRIFKYLFLSIYAQTNFRKVNFVKAKTFSWLVLTDFERARSKDIRNSTIFHSQVDGYGLRRRSFTAIYDAVYDRTSPYISVLHGSVLRPYISVTVYGELRWYTGKYGAKRRPYTDSVYRNRKRSFFSPYITVFLRIRHGDIRS